MKLIAQLQLTPTPEQAAGLLATLETANAACDYLSGLAWQMGTFKKFDLHHLGYEATRAAFPLSSQVVVRCVAKVADAYKLDAKTKRTFKSDGAISYDARILSFKMDAQTVSIWTLDGRQTIPFVCGDGQRELLASQKGECALTFVKGRFYLQACCEAPEAAPVDAQGVLGVDLGIVEIATTSNGKSYSGEKVKSVRRRYRSLRARLQKCGTKSAKRHLKKLSKKQANFVRSENHRISKEIVETAKQERKALALETLTGIRERANGFNREMRWQMGNWAFFQLQSFVVYKAKRAGVPVRFIDPRNTSRTCHACGHCEKANRKSQARFVCRSCGHEANADKNAALNISRKADASERAAVNPPIVSSLAA